MATSKALNTNRLRTIFLNLWNLFYCFPNFYYYLNRNSKELLVELSAVSTNTSLCWLVTIFYEGFQKTPKATTFHLHFLVQTPHFTSLFLSETHHLKGLFL